MHAFTTRATERDGRITEYLVDEVVHCWFFEPTGLARFACEGCRSTDLLIEEVANIYN